LVGVLGAQYLLIGALDLLIVGLAIDVLDIGESGVGYLNSAVGVGGLLAGVVTAMLVGRRHLAPPLLMGLLGAGVALIVLGMWTTTASAFVLIAAAGFGRTVFDVTGRTLLQRTAPSSVIAGVFGMLESLMNAGLAAGVLLVPLLITVAGVEAAMVGAGAVFVALVIVLGRRLIRVDEDADMPQVEIQLLRSIPIFAPLPAPALEGLARSLEPLTVPAGEVLMREGEPGDRYYAIAGGQLRVTREGQEISVRGRGDGVGEIALIKRVPRTATVTAVTDAQLYALEEEPFLIALTGHAAAAAAADRTVEERSQEP
jgi:MFS family permease